MLPSNIMGSSYDVGRSIALWVSAYEIAVHPGTGQSNSGVVSGELNKVQWIKSDLSDAKFFLPSNLQQALTLPQWLCRTIYNLRNDYLHGNDVQDKDLVINGMPSHYLAAALYRFVLTGLLDIHFKEAPAADADTESAVKHAAAEYQFKRPQRAHEEALLKAVEQKPSPAQH
jgi:hypothetical protein